MRRAKTCYAFDMERNNPRPWILADFCTGFTCVGIYVRGHGDIAQNLDARQARAVIYVLWRIAPRILFVLFTREHGSISCIKKGKPLVWEDHKLCLFLAIFAPRRPRLRSAVFFGHQTIKFLLTGLSSSKLYDIIWGITCIADLENSSLFFVIGFLLHNNVFTHWQ